MGIEIRTACFLDGHALFYLIRASAAQQGKLESMGLTEEIFQREFFSDDPHFSCLLAVSEGVIVGYALYYPTFPTWLGPCLYLEDLFVREGYRGKGIDEELLKGVLKVAHKGDYRRLHLSVADWNENASRFYKRLGGRCSETQEITVEFNTE